jgi:hypothetical protein
VREQPGLGFHSPTETGECTVRADHAVTRRDDRNRIASVRGADRAHRAGIADVPRHLRVAAGFSIGNREQRRPGPFLEIGAAEIEGQFECAAMAREVFAELARGLEQDRMFGSFDGRVEGNLRCRVPAPDERDERLVGGGEVEGADGGIERGGENGSKPVVLDRERSQE